MKKRVFSLGIILLTILLMPNVQAQKFGGGFQFGLSTSEISGDRFNGPSKAGIYLGAFTNLRLSTKTSLQLELNYVQKGSRKVPDSTSTDSYLLRINYMELPLFVKYDITSKITFEAGPYIGFLIHHYEEQNCEEVISDPPFEKTDIGANIGLYYTLLKHLRANVRYSNTLFFPVQKRGSGNTYWLKKGRYNEVLSFTLHYDF
jgi:hypothetical protein